MSADEHAVRAIERSGCEERPREVDARIPENRPGTSERGGASYKGDGVGGEKGTERNSCVDQRAFDHPGETGYAREESLAATAPVP